MKFSHIALPVSDIERSRAFYAETLGIEGTAREVEDGLLFTTADGFVLAFLEGEPTPGHGRLHFGFGRESAEQVRELREQLSAAGVSEVEFVEMDGFVSMKFEDPDGYVLEVFWEETE
jgi:catechol 2,3-dioxygenase-like lactoylglutathione lyase family enzyme